MMNYETFKKEIIEKFMDFLPKSYKNMKLEIHHVNKVNKVMDGISLIDNKPMTISPTIYINDMYDHYQKIYDYDLEKVLIAASNFIVDAIEKAPQIAPDFDMTRAKDNIVFQLVNTEQNKEMLAGYPTVSFRIYPSFTDG